MEATILSPDRVCDPEPLRHAAADWANRRPVGYLEIVQLCGERRSGRHADADKAKDGAPYPVVHAHSSPLRSQKRAAATALAWRNSTA
jgi:hypothetical protein